jgi:formylglycine-generating enzyme required for sulfatase activity
VARALSLDAATNSSVATDDWKGWPNDAPLPAIAPFDVQQAKTHQEDWAKHLGVPVEYTNSVGMKFRLIPPGEFLMGSTDAEMEVALKAIEGQEFWQKFFKTEGPQHKVILTKPFYLGVHEVTQDQYTKVIGKNPSFWSSTGSGKNAVVGIDTSQYPVENVTWNEIAEFCKSLSRLENLVPEISESHLSTTEVAAAKGYRLPTEAEWEFACRAGTTTTYWSGDTVEDLAKAGWFKANSKSHIQPVGQLSANPFGLFDTHGNVCERTQDRWEATLYQQFLGRPAINPGQQSFGKTSCVVVSGGFDFEACFSRSALSAALSPNDKFGNNGFRVLLPVTAVKSTLK